MARVAWATSEDLIRTDSRIKDASNSEVPAQWEFYITKAENLIKGKIGTRYPITFTSIPPMLRGLTIDLAKVYVYRDQFQGISLLPNQNNEAVEEKLMKQINDIAEGKCLLYGADDTLIAQNSGLNTIKSTTDGYTPTFDMDSEVTTQIDPDHIEDIIDARDEI